MALDKPKFETFTGEDGLFYSRIVARNGEPMFRSSQGYKNEEDAEQSIFWLIGVIQAGFYTVKLERHERQFAKGEGNERTP